MKILLLSFYYPPDLCAGSFRAKALVQALRETGGGEVEVDVVTTMPNRYASHQQDAPAFEANDGVRVSRIPLSAHRSGMLDQSRAFLDYAWGVKRLTRARKWDIVVATSSRLMTGALGAQVAKRSGALLYLDIRDLFTNTVADIHGRSWTSRLWLPLLHSVERRTIRAAARINVVSAGFLPHMRTLAPCQACRVFTNGIDASFAGWRITDPGRDPDAPWLIVYAGNIGEGQGLERVLPEAARMLGASVQFRVIGDGGRRAVLANRFAAKGIENVTLLPPVPREALIDHYREADALFLHLNDYPVFRRVLPSKIFEYGATGKPVLAGVEGYAAEFLRAEVPDALIFPPCDAAGLVARIRGLASTPRSFDRSRFCERYGRMNIMSMMARDILSLGVKSGS